MGPDGLDNNIWIKLYYLPYTSCNTCYVLANDKTATDSDFEGVESVIAHEYFHNWTGNRVTCRDWFQLSLKEGLTVFRDQEFSSDMNSRAVKRVEDAQIIINHQFAEDAGPMAHPIRPDSYIEMNNFYTVTVYNKGAEVIRMIHTLIGEKGFQNGMKLYFERHDGQAVTCEDFVKSMEDASDTDLQQFRYWYSQAGTPEVNIKSKWDAEKGRYSLTFQQNCNATPNQTNKVPFLIPIKLALYKSDGQLADINISSDIGSEISTNDNNTHNNAEVDVINKESVNEVIYQLKDVEETITFNNLDSEPVPSLLRGFTAPVKIKFEYTDQQLAHLLSNDSDSYSCWNAGQTLLCNNIIRMTEALQSNEAVEEGGVIVSAFTEVLGQSDVDPSLLALNLNLPSLGYLIEQFNVIPFNELVMARNTLSIMLATELRPELIKTYKMAVSESVVQDDRATGWRRLQNSCLSLLND